MGDITIPRAALEAGITAFAEAEVNDYTSQAEDLRAAFLAMLSAWPGMHIHEWQRPWLGGMSGSDLILPLTENPNAEA
tara:strand:+ start:2348 stop:2581 length:234 start_codon:yes stop_codon:yes gene_type:complete